MILQKRKTDPACTRLLTQTNKRALCQKLKLKDEFLYFTLNLKLLVSFRPPLFVSVCMFVVFECMCELVITCSSSAELEQNFTKSLVSCLTKDHQSWTHQIGQNEMIVLQVPLLSSDLWRTVKGEKFLDRVIILDTRAKGTKRPTNVCVSVFVLACGC